MLELYNPIILFLLLVLIALIPLIRYAYYRGKKGSMRRFIRANRLKGRGGYLHAEFLRQMFHTYHPKHKTQTTQEFIDIMSTILKFHRPTNDYEGGCFEIDSKSPLLIPPPPTQQNPYIPPEFEESVTYRIN
jgi:hypothetical protein